MFHIRLVPVWVRARDDPRLAQLTFSYFSLCFLFLPALVFQPVRIDREGPITSFGWAVRSLVDGCFGALGGVLFCLDYIYLQRYLPAILFSWFCTAALIQIPVNNPLAGNYFAAAIFACLLAGVASFCVGRIVIDRRDERHQWLEEDDPLAIPKVLAPTGWTLSVFGFFFVNAQMGPSSDNNSNKVRLNWPDSHCYALLTALTLLGAILISYHRSDRVAYLVAFPMGAASTLFLFQAEWRREVGGGEEYGPALSLLFLFLSILPGPVIFFTLKKFCVSRAASVSRFYTTEYISVPQQGVESQRDRELYQDLTPVAIDEKSDSGPRNREEDEENTNSGTCSRSAAKAIEMV